MKRMQNLISTIIIGPMGENFNRNLVFGEFTYGNSDVRLFSAR
jgi:hypothetical protein